MSDIVVFVPPKLFEHERSARITALLHMHNINTTNNIKDATVVLVQNNLPELAMLLRMEELRFEAEHKIEIVTPHVIEPVLLSETNKKTYTKYQIQKKFNQTKQIMYKHTCFNRVRKR